MKKTIVLTGGGTAGHIMPNLALLPEISKYYDKVYYLGSKNSMEEKIIKNYKNITFISIPTTKLVRALTLKNLAMPFKLIKSICKTKKIIKSINPDVIFCKGGFVSVPVAIAGKMCKIPVVSHESDYSMGLANKIILKFAKAMCTSFEDTSKSSKKCVFTGCPIRQDIFLGNKNNLFLKANFDSKKPIVLFFGGSLGALKINQAVIASIHELLKRYNVLHITGKNNKTPIKSKDYFQTEFTDSIQDYFECADIVVCRGGANSLFELLALKKPMLIIPLSKAESRGDQIENAKYFVKKGYAKALFEENLNSQTLILSLQDIEKNLKSFKNNLNLSSQNSNKKIVEIINKYSK